MTKRETKELSNFFQTLMVEEINDEIKDDFERLSNKTVRLKEGKENAFNRAVKKMTKDYIIEYLDEYFLTKFTDFGDTWDAIKKLHEYPGFNYSYAESFDDEYENLKKYFEEYVEEDVEDVFVEAV